MALLLLGAAAFSPGCLHYNLPSRYSVPALPQQQPLTSDFTRVALSYSFWSTSNGALTLWETGKFMEGTLQEDGSSRVYSSRSPGGANVLEIPVISTNAIVLAQDSTKGFNEDKESNPWLKFTRATKESGSWRPPFYLDNSFTRHIFDNPGGQSHAKWADRQAAVLEVQNAEDVDAALLRMGDKLDLSDLNLLLRRFANLGKWDLAYKLFKWMEREKKISVTSYSAFIIMLGKEGRVYDAICVYNSLNEELQLNTLIGNSVLAALENTKKAKKILKMFRRLQKDGYGCDQLSYSIMLRACGKLPRGYEISQELLQEMRSKGLKLDSCAYGALLSFYSAKRMEKKARALIEEMRSEGVDLTFQHYVYLINMYGDLGKLKEVEEVFAAIYESGLEPDESLYGSLLKAYAANGLLAEARTTLSEIQLQGMRIDEEMYTALMAALISSNEVYEAHEHFIEMRRAGVRPGAKAYTLLIEAYASIGDRQMVDKLAAEYFTRTRNKDEQELKLLNKLLKAYFSFGDDDKMTNTLRTMDERGVLPNKTTFNVLIGYLCKKDLLALAMKAYDKMRYGGLKPDGDTYSVLLEALSNAMLTDRSEFTVPQLLAVVCKRASDFSEDAYKVFSQMRRSKNYCSQPALEQFIRAHARYGRWRMVKKALKVMKKADYEPTETLLEAVLAEAAKDDQDELMIQLMRKVKERECSIQPEVLEMVKQRFVGTDLEDA